MNCGNCGQFGHVECRLVPEPVVLPKREPYPIEVWIDNWVPLDLWLETLGYVVLAPVIIAMHLVAMAVKIIALQVMFVTARPMAAPFFWLSWMWVPTITLLPILAPAYALGMTLYWPAMLVVKLARDRAGLMRPTASTEFGGDSDVYGGDR